MKDYDLSELSRADIDTIIAISTRAADTLPGVDLTRLALDLAAVHLHVCSLRLEEFLHADTYEFSHDILGILENFNRETGELSNLFLPRYAK